MKVREKESFFTLIPQKTQFHQQFLFGSAPKSKVRKTLLPVAHTPAKQQG